MCLSSRQNKSRVLCVVVMYIRKSSRVYRGKTYTKHLLVESVQTPKGPRQRSICSLGSLEPAPREQWLALAHKLQSTLQGQLSLETAQIERELAERKKTLFNLDDTVCLYDLTSTYFEGLAKRGLNRKPCGDDFRSKARSFRASARWFGHSESDPRLKRSE